MPKSKPRVSELQSSSEAKPVEPKPPEKPEKDKLPGLAQPPLWSTWIWDENETLYYRGRLRADKTWEYEYAAGPPPIPHLLAIASNEPSRSLISRIAPIKCTKEDLELKEVYPPDPVYADEPPSLEAICDAMTLQAPLATVEPTKPKPEERPAINNNANKIEKKEPEKTESKKSSRPNTPKSPRKLRFEKVERIEAYLEGLEIDDRSMKNLKHSEKRGVRHKAKRK